MMWLIGFGGAIGAASRFLISSFLQKKGKRDFPLATWAINITGSFLLGIFAAQHFLHAMPDWLWSLVGIGFCGAFTTFSTFGTETVTLIEKKKYPTAILYVVSSVVLGVMAAAMGYMLML
jgi:fluoride exporter